VARSQASTSDFQPVVPMSRSMALIARRYSWPSFPAACGATVMSSWNFTPKYLLNRSSLESVTMLWYIAGVLPWRVQAANISAIHVQATIGSAVT
jgi:hypothetical protein